MNRDNPDLIENEDWVCLSCTITNRANIFPFGHINNFEMENLFSLDSSCISDQIPEFDIFSDALNAGNLKSNDIDENIVYNLNSRYYSCQEFFKLNNTKDLKLYHANVNGYSSHVDSLREFLAQCNWILMPSALARHLLKMMT